MKKIISLLLALVMIFALATTAFAEADPPSYSISITNALKDEIYTAYKIFDLTYNAEDHTKIAYSIGTSSEWWSVVANGTEAEGVITANGLVFTLNTAGTYNVTKGDDFNAATFANLLNENKNGKTAAGNGTGASGSATISVDSAGYYFVDTSLGSLCSLNSAAPNANIEEKNVAPSIDKKQSASEDNYDDALVELSYGDTIYYQLAITKGTGDDQEIVVTDTLTTGLTLNEESIIVSVDGATVEAGQYEITNKTAQGFTLKLKDTYVSGIDADTEVIVTYTATLNNNATVNNATANSSTVTMKYSKQTYTDAVLYVATYDVLLKKTDGTTYLPGAGFKLYDAATGGNQITVAKDGKGYYVDAAGTMEILVESEAGSNIRGLAPGTYYLEETTVPDGYNKLSERKPVTITTGATAAVEVTVVNNAGSTLPSTGGIGTTLFYVIGGLLMVGAVVVLVTKKRIS